MSTQSFANLPRLSIRENHVLGVAGGDGQHGAIGRVADVQGKALHFKLKLLLSGFRVPANEMILEQGERLAVRENAARVTFERESSGKVRMSLPVSASQSRCSPIMLPLAIHFPSGETAMLVTGDE